MPPAIPKSRVLLHEWDYNDNRYRIIAATSQEGWVSHIIERLGQDGLGEPRWDIVKAVTNEDNLLLSALCSRLSK